ncbi:MAG: Unknown protein [uncultured Sulfurovum sp.]|uniref:Secreted protein n=1 Tax=uncultured Sulfurovum sp. TaxID=269237 RepID=A0A6S6TPI9_9BACT|nr:MAG: Unknown protein [uncultured Sulfurovum sp.]
MHKKILLFISLIVFNTPLSAMDLNETHTIITDATEATITLQDEFNSIINEVPIEITTKTNEEIINLNSSSELITPITMVETNQSHEQNSSLVIINTIDTNQSMNSNEPSKTHDINISACKEHNSSIKQHDFNTNTLADTGCTDIQGDSKRGLDIFKTRIKPYCKMNGETFAKQFMQEDWDDIYYEKEFKMEILKACPKMKDRYKDEWTPHLYQFAFDYASDSDAIPEC